MLYRGLSCTALLEAGIDEPRHRAASELLPDENDPKGEVSSVLGAGNVSSIPPMDALYKMFVDGQRLRAQDEPGQRVGGAVFRAGALRRSSRESSCASSTAAATSARTSASTPASTTFTSPAPTRPHDRIVWGPPGPEQERRRRENDPLLKKTHHRPSSATSARS